MTCFITNKICFLMFLTIFWYLPFLVFEYIRLKYPVIEIENLFKDPWSKIFVSAMELQFFAETKKQYHIVHSIMLFH